MQRPSLFRQKMPMLYRNTHTLTQHTEAAQPNQTKLAREESNLSPTEGVVRNVVTGHPES